MLDVTTEDTAYADERTTALEGLGDGLYTKARCGEAVKVFEQLSSSATSSLVRLRAMRKAMRASLIRGDYSQALEITGKAVEDPRLDRLEWARIRLFKGMVKNWGGKPKEALQDMEESIRIFEGEYSLPDMTDMLAEMGTAYSMDGQLENAIAATLRACALGEYARNLNRQDYASAMSCIVFKCSGLKKEALKAVAEAFEITEKESDPVSRGFSQSFVMGADLALGDYSHALEIANKAVENPALNPLESARMRLAKAIVRAWGAKFKEALEDMEESLRVLEGEYSLSDLTEILQEMAPAYMAIGQLENAIATGLRSRALSEYSRGLDRGNLAYIYLCVVFLGCNLEKEGIEAVAEAVKLGEKISDPVSRAWAQGFSYFMSSQLLEAKAAGKLFSGLPLESMRSFGTGAKIKFFMSSLISGALREFKQGLKAAIAQSLKGAECAEETDSYMARSYNYGNLTRQYAAVGDMEQAEKYYKKLAKISEETIYGRRFDRMGTYFCLVKPVTFHLRVNGKKLTNSTKRP